MKTFKNVENVKKRYTIGFSLDRSKQNGTILRLHDMCPKQSCKCQKQITFTPRLFELEGSGLKSFMKKVFKGSKTAWNRFLKPAVNAAAPIVGLAVAAK